MVATAGALAEMLVQKIFQLDISNFSVMVFDECHHATGGHKYITLLELVQKCNKLHQPRLLGLSASPVCNAQTLDSATKQLNELRQLFIEAKVYCPLQTVLQPRQITWRCVRLQSNRLQSNVFSMILSDLKRLVPTFQESCNIEGNWDFYKQEGRDFIYGCAARQKRLDILNLIYKYDINRLFGPAFLDKGPKEVLKEVLKEEVELDVAINLRQNFESGGLSEYLVALESIISNKINENSDSRIIVFVERR